MPQSNQRGIETRALRIPITSDRLPPQSNQRGIETFLADRLLDDFSNRLNRTSVGLKRAAGTSPASGTLSLNRTSVGLKHGRRPGAGQLGSGLNRTSVGLKPPPGGGRSAPRIGLNRTSVGLKLRPPIRPSGSRTRPQSNQRGIETAESPSPRMGAGPASIEPAWD